MRLLQALLIAHALLLATVTISEAALLDIAPSGNGRFIVTGSALDGVAGMDLTIAYDAALGKPAISLGGIASGATMAVNTNNSGMIRIAIITAAALPGSGQVVAITFSGQTGVGSITSAKATMIDSKGVAIPSIFTISGSGTTGTAAEPATAGVPFSTTTTSQNQGQQQPQSTSKAPTTTIAATPSIGTLTLPGEPSTPTPQKSGETAQPDYQQAALPQPVPRGEEHVPAENAPAAVTTKSPELKQTSYADIAERFRNFKGERTLAAFTELFAKPLAEQVRQDPAIAISNGSNMVKIFVALPAIATGSLPTVATKGAKLLSLKNDDSANGWVIELTPRKNALQATVSILFDSRIIEIPLILAPPAAKEFSFSKSEVAAFLKDSGAAKPLFDLNSDGKHDYLDDYLYAGHYLLRKKGESKEGTTRKTP